MYSMPGLHINLLLLASPLNLQLARCSAPGSRRLNRLSSGLHAYSAFLTQVGLGQGGVAC
jgi:hypothetical protein